MFARIIHHKDLTKTANYWEVRSKDGSISYYGRNPDRDEHPELNPVPGTIDPNEAFLFKPNPTNPNDTVRIFAWKLTLTKDPFGNRIEYLYDFDEGTDGPHRWKQPLLEQIRYVEYEGTNGPAFLVTVTVEYEDRPDPFSEYRAGFEIRTTKCCKAITVRTHPELATNADERQQLVRRYEFTYQQNPCNGVSLLTPR